MIAGQAGGNAKAIPEGHGRVRASALDPEAGLAGQCLGPLASKGYSQVGGDRLRRNRLLALLGPTCGARQWTCAHKEHLSAIRYAHLSSPFYSTVKVTVDVCDSAPEATVTVTV